MAYETAAPGSGKRSQEAKEKASEAAGQARESAGEVATTAREQARGVVDESRAQVQDVTGRMRDRLGEESRTQAQRAAEMLRDWSDDLASMAENAEGDSPVRGVVQQVAERGHGAADFLDQRGIEGVTDEMRSFARRRPGVFLAGAALAGFAVGRLARAARKESKEGVEQGQGSAGPAQGLPQPRQEGPAVYDVPPHDSPYDRSRYVEGS